MMRRIMITLMMITVIGAGACSNQEEPAETTPVDVDTVTVDTGVSNVSAEGRVVPLDSAILSFQISGEVAEILVAEGDVVNAGDPILKLDDTDQQTALEQAQAAVTQAEANVTTAEAGVISAQAALDAAQVGVEAAQAQLALVEAGATAQQVALNETQVAAAQAGVVQASGQQALVLEGPTNAQIQAAEAQLAAAKAAVVPLQLVVDRYRNGSVSGTDEQKEAAQLELNAAIANVNSAQAALDEVLAGARNPDRQAAAGAVSGAVANQQAAEAQLNLLLAGSREEEIAIAQVNVDQASNGVTEAELAVQQAEVGLDQAASGLTEAEQALAAAQSAFDKTILTASFSATVASITPKVGEIVVAGSPVVTLADFSEWHVETTDLTELSVVSVGRDFPVEITVDAFPGETLSGRVIDISPVSDIVLGDVTYRVTIDLDDDDALPLRWGMTAFARIDVDQ
ncbi:MAG: HlyD family efflux transporter periplasmic adaptor subunit [Ardenticatenaceae bacterium]|nr:HlyD family efflux transporter periplasmic adaptor subunit [Ardenticatenaceae bacterium]